VNSEHWWAVNEATRDQSHSLAAWLSAARQLSEKLTDCQATIRRSSVENWPNSLIADSLASDSEDFQFDRSSAVSYSSVLTYLVCRKSVASANENENW